MEVTEDRTQPKEHYANHTCNICGEWHETNLEKGYHYE